MREQVCTTVCPYGRLQGVLLDKHSYNVAYDYKRGEPRAKGKERESSGVGDCVDCGLCVRVCPTGIDIRNGTQLECVNCTACIDACDEIMEATEQPKGLIRYTSEDAIEQKIPFSLSARAKAYVALLGVLMVIFSFILANRTDVEVNILRSYGTTFEKLDNGDYVNFYTYRMLNKTQQEQKVTFGLVGKAGKVTIIGMDTVKVAPQKSVEGTILVTLPDEEVDGLKTTIDLQVIDGNKIIDEQDVYFSGPFKLKSK
jgi:cytochrome c oxidase accessory protein FixG